MQHFRAVRSSALAALSLATVFSLGACAPASSDGGGSGGSAAGRGGSHAGGGGGSATGGAGGTSTGGTGVDAGSTGGAGGADQPSGGAAGSPAGGDGGSATDDGGTPTGGSSGGDGGTPDANGPDTAAGAVTFSALYTEVFGSTTCAGAACHNPGVKDGLSFKDKATAFNSLVPKVTAVPAALLLGRLQSTDVKMRMPKDKPALSAATIQKVKDWITAGAKND